MNKLKLTYFDFSGGRAEPARLAMHIGGIPFEDHRFASKDFAEIRKTTPLNQVPTLHLNDVQVTQSDAITRYVGKLAGLYPVNEFQALLCDEVMGALEDVNVKIGATFGMEGDALKGARDALVTGPLPRYLRWLQNQLEDHGGEYFADNRLTIADLKALVILRWLSGGRSGSHSKKFDCRRGTQARGIYEPPSRASGNRSILCKTVCIIISVRRSWLGAWIRTKTDGCLAVFPNTGWWQNRCFDQ